MTMLAEEGQFPLDLGPVRRRGAIAKVAQRTRLKIGIAVKYDQILHMFT